MKDFGILTVVESAPPESPGLTSAEAAAKMKCSVGTAQRRLGAAVRAGRLCVGYALRPSVLGILKPVPVYRRKG